MVRIGIESCGACLTIQENGGDCRGQIAVAATVDLRVVCASPEGRCDRKHVSRARVGRDEPLDEAVGDEAGRVWVVQVVVEDCLRLVRGVDVSGREEGDEMGRVAKLEGGRRAVAAGAAARRPSRRAPPQHSVLAVVVNVRAALHVAVAVAEQAGAVSSGCRWSRSAFLIPNRPRVLHTLVGVGAGHGLRYNSRRSETPSAPVSTRARAHRARTQQRKSPEQHT